MSAPATRLDARFSDPATEATPWSAALEIIEQAQLFWITTVRADGRPHVTPLVAVWQDDALHFCTGDTEQKWFNLAANPQVALLTGNNAWDRGLDVVVEGAAKRVTDQPTLERLADAWRTKWDGQWQFEARDGRFHHPGGHGHADVFAVAPAKVMAFGKGTSTHTTHRF